VPSLSERKDDIPILVNYFIQQICKETGKPVMPIDEDALAELQAYSWGGNIRELRNVIERLLILSGDRITKDDVLNFAIPSV
jgi:DNA-binding NtrC family response regulator